MDALHSAFLANIAPLFGNSEPCEKTYWKSFIFRYEIYGQFLQDRMYRSGRAHIVFKGDSDSEGKQKIVADCFAKQQLLFGYLYQFLAAIDTLARQQSTSPEALVMEYNSKALQVLLRQDPIKAFQLLFDVILLPGPNCVSLNPSSSGGIQLKAIDTSTATSQPSKPTAPVPAVTFSDQDKELAAQLLKLAKSPSRR